MEKLEKKSLSRTHTGGSQQMARVESQSEANAYIKYQKASTAARRAGDRADLLHGKEMVEALELAGECMTTAVEAHEEWKYREEEARKEHRKGTNPHWTREWKRQQDERSRWFLENSNLFDSMPPLCMSGKEEKRWNADLIRKLREIRSRESCTKSSEFLRTLARRRGVKLSSRRSSRACDVCKVQTEPEDGFAYQVFRLPIITEDKQQDQQQPRVMEESDTEENEGSESGGDYAALPSTCFFVHSTIKCVNTPLSRPGFLSRHVCGFCVLYLNQHVEKATNAIEEFESMQAVVSNFCETKDIAKLVIDYAV
jgi:hypothetical protein